MLKRERPRQKAVSHKFTSRLTAKTDACQMEIYPVLRSMVTTTAGNDLTGIHDSAQFGDLHAKFVRPFGEVIPGERARPLRSELVIKWHRIVIVQENEVVAHWQFEPRADDETMLYGTRDRSNVHDAIRADEFFGFNVVVHVLVWSRRS
jgi:hypothetical protein